jgi:hypothetical protein
MYAVRDEAWHKFVGGNTSLFIVATDAKAVMQLAQAAFEAGWAARKLVDYEARSRSIVEDQWHHEVSAQQGAKHSHARWLHA